MVFCDNCGHVLKPTAKFCGECGTALDTPQTDNSQNQTNYAPPPTLPKQKRSMGKAKKFGIIALIVIIFLFLLPFPWMDFDFLKEGSDSGPRAPSEMSESEKIDQILSEFPERIQQIKRAQLEDCKYNMAYLQSDALGDMYKERCFNAILGR